MACVADVAILTSRLQQLAQELHTEAIASTTNLSRLADLSDQVGEYADQVAVTFGELNASLERCPVLQEARATRESVAAPVAMQAAADTMEVDASAREPATAVPSDPGDANDAGTYAEADPGRLSGLTALLRRGFAPARAGSNGYPVTEPPAR